MTPGLKLPMCSSLPHSPKWQTYVWVSWEFPQASHELNSKKPRKGSRRYRVLKVRGWQGPYMWLWPVIELIDNLRYSWVGNQWCPIHLLSHTVNSSTFTHPSSRQRQVAQRHICFVISWYVLWAIMTLGTNFKKGTMKKLKKKPYRCAGRYSKSYIHIKYCTKYTETKRAQKIISWSYYVEVVGRIWNQGNKVFFFIKLPG